jgi:uncharacterized protein
VTAVAPLLFPLATLLAEPPGAVRRYEIHGATIALPDDLRLAEPIEGDLEVARTNRGVLLKAELDTAIEQRCSRCLRDIVVPVHVSLDEEALPILDISTGAPIDRSREPDVARLTPHHELELALLVAEVISLAEPIAPLCEPDCPGLCAVCGERLGPGHVAHQEDDIDPRLEALRGFRVDADPESE